jgi:DNA polymerase-3 subunit gamma/tau
MTDTAAYQVLARKYRQESFADLVGQETLVQPRRNAL